MKQKLLLSLFALLTAMTAWADVEINETNFPDANFRKWVLSQTYGADGVLTEEEIAGVTSINVNSKSIQSLKGIESFTSLKKLQCHNNQLTALDVSECPALTELACFKNQINEEAMDALVESLPTTSKGIMYVIWKEGEQNIMSSLQVAAAKAKGWVPYYRHGNSWLEYNGTIVMEDIVINETNFPDANFRSWLLNQTYYGEDGVLTEEEITGVKDIFVNGIGIQNLKGIEYFTSLTSLYCENNQLTSLDVSKNNALAELRCDINQLTSLDVSKNTALKDLVCSSNQLTALDLSKNTALYKLQCVGNQLAVLDVSQNKALRELSCGGNKLTALDVSQNTALTQLSCSSNSLTTLDVSQNIALTSLSCSSNQLTMLDVKKNTKLTKLSCSSNLLTSLDVSKHTALKELGCSNNLLTSLDVSKNTALTSLSCSSNLLISLDVSQNTALYSLSCSSNQLTSLDVSNNTALISLYCYQNQIRGVAMDALVKSLPYISDRYFSLYVIYYDNEQNVMTPAQVAAAKARKWIPRESIGIDSAGNEIWQAYVGEGLAINEANFPDVRFRNFLLGQTYGSDGVITAEEIAGVTSIDASIKEIRDLKGIENFTALTTLKCGLNRLTTLDVSQNTALTMLDCTGNKLTTLDVSQNTALETLYCSSNKLTSLDVSKHTKLTRLSCGSNQLTALDVLQNTKLDFLVCDRNPLTSLDVSHNTALSKLECFDDQLTSLDVSHNTALTYLDCSRNQLTELDVSACTQLTKLYIDRNQIYGPAMDALVESLPNISEGKMYVLWNENEQNVMTTIQVAAAKEKGWVPYSYNINIRFWFEYRGSEPVNGMAVDTTNFPDENFRNWVASQPYGADGVLTDEEIADIKIVNVQDKGIKDLKGIENFKALTWLMCGKNQMTTLDVSNNTELEYLWCFGNQLTELNVSENTSLTGIWCGVNQLTSLDVSKNTELTRLDCSQNQLTELDVTKNAALEKLFCSDNQLTTLDVSQCPKLTLLWCNNNKLSALNVMGCAALTDIFCYKNQITDTDMDALVEVLPIIDSGKIYVVCGDDEQNVMTASQVASAKEKGWTPICLEMGEGWIDYSDKAPSYYPGIGNWWEYFGCEDPTGISRPTPDLNGGEVFDLQGRKLSGKPAHGIYIEGGKKKVK